MREGEGVSPDLVSSNGFGKSVSVFRASETPSLYPDDRDNVRTESAQPDSCARSLTHHLSLGALHSCGRLVGLMQRRPHISAPFRPSRGAEEAVAAAEAPPPRGTSQARCTVKPQYAAVDPARPEPTAGKLKVLSKAQPNPTRGSFLQENPLAGGKETAAAWSGHLQPHREPLGERAQASLATAATPRPIGKLRAVPRDAASQLQCTAGSLTAGTLATPPQLESAQKPGWKASRAALAFSASARLAAFEDSPVLRVSQAASCKRSAADTAASAVSSALQQADTAKTAAAAKPQPQQHVEVVTAPQRTEQARHVAVTAESLRQPGTVAAAAIKGGLGARTAAGREFTAASSSSSSRPAQSSSLESKSYRSSAVFRALAARGYTAAGRRADAAASGSSPLKRRGAISSSPARAQRAGPVPSQAAAAVGLPTLAKDADVASRPMAREQVSCSMCVQYCPWAAAPPSGSHSRHRSAWAAVTCAIDHYSVDIPLDKTKATAVTCAADVPLYLLTG